MNRAGASMLAGLVLLGTATAQEPAAFRDDRERLGYALGMNFAYRLREQAVDIDTELFIRGFRDARAGGATLLDTTELRAVLDALLLELARQPLPPAAGKLSGIRAAFRLDPGLTRSLYMGDRWISRPVFTGVRQQGDSYTLDARASGVDARGGEIHIQPEWIPSDPGMVTVSPAADGAVRITVLHPGESTLIVAAQGIARTLTIRATHDGTAMQVEITQ